MNKTITPDQSLVDIAIQHDGSLEELFTIARLNNVSVTEDLVLGAKVQILDQVTDSRVVKILLEGGWKPASAIAESELLCGIDYWAIETEFEVQ